MDKIKFAQLIAYVARQHAISFTTDELTDMYEIIEAGTKQTEIKFEPATHDQIAASAGSHVQFMMNAMRDNKKIEATKACRMLTGLGLKEAKDMVELAMNCVSRSI